MFATGRLAKKLSRPGVAFRALPVTSRVALGVLIVVVLGAVLAPCSPRTHWPRATPSRPLAASTGSALTGRDATCSPASCTARATR